MSYDTDRLSCVTQAIAGPKQFVYKDTGGETIATFEGAGFFSNAKDMGADTGDLITIVDMANGTQYKGRFSAVQDTGHTQGTVSLDTGPDIPG